MPPPNIIAAVWQGLSVPGNVEANLILLQRAVAAGKAQGVHLIVFPELFLSGYDLGADRLRTEARAQTSAELAFIGAVAKEHEIAMCVPYVERGADGVICYNAAAVFDATGALVHSYRKTHLWSAYERSVFKPGGTRDLKVVDLALSGGLSVRVGTLICFDIEFPEPARVLRLQGAELLLVPTALAVGPADYVTPYATVPARAAENGVFLLYSNFWGKSLELEYCGSSAIVAPNGQDLVRAGRQSDGLLVAQLVHERYTDYKERNPYMLDRRPELYAVLADDCSGK